MFDVGLRSSNKKPCTAFKKSWLITKKKNYKSFVNNNFKFKKEYVSSKFYTG